jgi:hypothetical protein
MAKRRKHSPRVRVAVRGYESPKGKARAKPAKRHWVKGYYRQRAKARKSK